MSTIEKLYEHYQEKRTVKLTVEQFTLFAEFFPALLIILSDGILDTEEKMYLDKLARNLAHAFSQDGLGSKRIKELRHIFVREFEYLIRHIEYWELRFLDSLKEHLSDFPESKETILDTLYLFAEASQDIDEAENRMITYLSEKLNLVDNHLAE